jgi:uncharacterized protein
MGMTWHAEVLFEGQAEGEALRLDAPISFWGGISPETSEITLAGHPQLDSLLPAKSLLSRN